MKRKEVWKQIPDYKDYEASTLGRIRSLKFNNTRILRMNGIDSKGYKRVNLSENKSQKSFRIGYLVLKTFVGERPREKEVSHLNSNCLDDRLKNLRYETHQENMNKVWGSRIKIFDFQINIIVRRKR